MSINEKAKLYYIENKEFILEKAKLYYIENIERIKEKARMYYHENKGERQLYNREYWAKHGHKYIEKRSTDMNLKIKQRLYYAEQYKQKKEYCVKVEDLPFKKSNFTIHFN